MIVRIFLLLAILFSAAGVRAQDTLIYRSLFEARVLSKVKAQQPVSDVSLFTAVTADSLETERIESTLLDFYTALTPRLNKADEKTKGRIIFDEVHKQFLLHYVDTAVFTDIFRTVHNHNCVSGTALYAIVLNHYGIPYEIREFPGHVYLIAWPQTHAIRFESTSPYGFTEPSLNAKEHEVRFLVAHHYISQDMVDRSGVAAAFDGFFYAQNAVTIQNVAGMQYLNKSRQLEGRRQFKEALTYLKKGDICFAGRKSKAFDRQTLLEQIVEDFSGESLEKFKYLAEYSNDVNTEKSDGKTESAFEAMMVAMLEEKSNETLPRQIYTLLTQRLKDKELINTITIIYNGHFAVYYNQKGKLEKSLQSAALAYKASPENTKTQSLIRAVVLTKISGSADGPAGLTALNKACADFPFLKEDAHIRSAYSFVYSSLCRTNFLADREKEGTYFMGLMEKEMSSTDPDFKRPETIVGYAYAEAGAYYARKGLHQKSLDIMNRGLTYAPDHPELKTRIDIVKKDMSYNRPKFPK